MTDPITYTGTRYTQPASDRNPFAVEWLTPSEEDLAPGTALREAIEETLASWHPNHSTDSGKITGYEEWIERLEGIDIPGEYGTRLDLGSQTDVPPYSTIAKIARAVAKDLR